MKTIDFEAESHGKGSAQIREVEPASPGVGKDVLQSRDSIAKAPQTISVWGTTHFIDRYYQRTLDRLPNINPKHFQVSGYLTEDARSSKFFLDVPGVARLVLMKKSQYFLGITILPPRLRERTSNG